MTDLSYGIKCRQKFVSFCHNARVWRTDRQTDRRTDRIWQQDRACALPVAL